jgi:large subunit ribosomal protein L17
MRHRKKNLKLGRSSSPRAAMLDNMVTSLFKHERIRTTDKKAQAAKRLAERLISYARQGSLASRRLAARTIRENRVLKKLFDEIAPRMKDRTSGFVTVTKLWPRPGDGALMAMMELHGAKMKVKAAKGEKGEKKVEPGEKKVKAPKPEKKKGEPKAKKESVQETKKEAGDKK